MYAGPCLTTHDLIDMNMMIDDKFGILCEYLLLYICC